MGNKSNIRCSQSISDLSHIQRPHKTKHSTQHKHEASASSGNPVVVDSRTFVRSKRKHNSDNWCGIPSNSNPVSNTQLSNTQPGNKSNRFSYSFFIDIKQADSNCQLDNVVKNESRSMDSLDGVLDMPHDSEDNFSSDSLEDNAEMLWTIREPRRCVSEHEILGGSQTRRCHSEENILNDDTEGNNRHSSASFYLRAHSTESGLTDESEYQYLFRQNETCKSTESILTDVSNDFNVASEMCYEEQKKPVFRTRSLQDTSQKHINSRNISVSKESASVESSPQLIRYFVIQKEIGFTSPVKNCAILEKLVETNTEEAITRNHFVKSHTFYKENKNLHLPAKPRTEVKPKNESFFIPFDSNGEKKMPPEALFKRLTSKPDKLTKENHPVVTHKPPKPQVKLSKMRFSAKKKDIQAERINEIKMKVTQWTKSNKENTSEPPSDIVKTQEDEALKENHAAQEFKQNSLVNNIKMPNVRLLSQNFEKQELISQLPGSGSSTPGTSSSCNSPKKYWQPRAQLMKRLPNHCVLPSKYQPGIK